MTRALALLLTLLTGFSGLVYEITWQKYLATLLGSHSEATSAVLGLYLGGLAAGYALFGWVARRSVERATRRGKAPPLLRIYGVAEIGIGLFAFAFPFLFEVIQQVSVWVPTGHQTISFAFDIVLCMLLIGPPTILMGGTIPLLTQALTRGLTDATRIHAFIYAFNTAGAFMGALAAGFILIHWLGLNGVLRAMGIVNLVAGAIFVALSFRREPAVRAAEPETATAGRVPRSFATLAVVALLAGFGMMVLQITFNRVAGLAFGSSHFAFAMVVAVFVLCIALGSFLVSALARIPPWLVAGSQWLLVLLLAGLYLVIPDAGYGAHVLRTFFRDHGQAFYMYQAATFAVGLAILMVPIGLSGALLPLLFHHLRNEVGDLGRIAGSLYSWNTVGSLAGALLGGYLLLFWLDLHHAYAVALGALAVGAGILTYRVAGAPMRVAGTLTLAAVVAIALLPEWDPMRLPIGTFRKRAPTPLTFAGADRFLADHNRNQVLLFHDDDPVASVVVLEAAQNKRARSIFTNGKPDGSTSGDYPTMCFAALIPALLTDDPSRGFVIGWGTGVTVGELAALPENEEVVVAEISPGVIESAPLFSSLNQRADKNPKVKILRSDAYRALLRSEGRFGVIASEPSNPWVSGVENLFSREFLEAARSRLTPGGIYAQWFHLYEVDAKTVEIVAATYASVFDQVAVWFAQGPDVLLIGMNDSSGYPDLATLRERFDQSGMRRGMARCSARSFEQLLAHELIPPGLLRAETVSAPIHSLHHPILSQNAAHAFFSGRPVELPRMAGSADANDDEFPKALLTQELGEGPIPEATLETVARYICRARRTAACAAWVARWRTAYPESAAARSYDPRREKRVGEVSTLSPAALHRVEQLMRRDLPASDPFWNLANLTHYFSIYYTHTAPFDRSLLRDQWSACLSAGSQAAQCETARARSDQELSRFHVPRRGGS